MKILKILGNLNILTFSERNRVLEHVKKNVWIPLDSNRSKPEPNVLVLFLDCDKTMKHNQPYDIWIDYVDEMGKSFRNRIDAYSHWMAMPKDSESIV